MFYEISRSIIIAVFNISLLYPIFNYKICNRTILKKGFFYEQLKQHQELLQKTALLVQQTFPDSFFIPRTIGLFKTINDHNIMIGKKGQADAYIMLPVMAGNIRFQIHIEVEFKTGKASQTNDQKSWEKEITERSGLYIIARKQQDVIDSILEHYRVFFT